MLNSSAVRSHKVSGCPNPLRSTISMEDFWTGRSFVFSIIISMSDSVCHNWISCAIGLLNVHLHHGCKQRGKGEMGGSKSKGIFDLSFLHFQQKYFFTNKRSNHTETRSRKE